MTWEARVGRTSVIIPVFNQAGLTQQCLRTLVAQGIQQIIVVDDGSTDGTQQILSQFQEQIQVVRHAENLGFAAACNHGAAAASGEYLVFLNNDTVPAPGWLLALETYADGQPQASIIGSKLLYPDQTVQHAGVVICQDRYPRHIYAGFPADHPAVGKSRRFQIVTGACMLVRRLAFDEARGFDPAFRNGFEDVDLCLRLGANGHHVHYCAESLLHHYESVSPGRFKLAGANVSLYRERWLNRVQPDDLQYYLEDGLIRMNYEGRYPFGIEVSPMLACLDGDLRQVETEQRLKELGRSFAELSRENTRLRVDLGRNHPDSELLRHQQLRQRICEVLQTCIPAGSTFLIISNGDSCLLDLPERVGWHFPQNERGVYAGYHPGNSEEAIGHLKELRAKGAEYLVVPAFAHWWLTYYEGFREYLETRASRLSSPEGVCVVFSLLGSRNETDGGTPAVILGAGDPVATGGFRE
jgi:GT2 family glycosyltransferase